MNRIKSERQQAGLSLKRLGEMVGLSDGTISRYESGAREPKLATWKKLAKALNVTPAWLQGIDGPTINNQMSAATKTQKKAAGVQTDEPKKNPTENLEPSTLYPVELPEAQVEFNPAILTIHNLDELQEAASNYALRFRSLVVTSETEKQVNKDATNLNQKIKALDKTRKETKRMYNQPLAKFEAEIKSISEPLQQARASIMEGVHKLQAVRADERKKMVNDMITLAEQRNGLDAGDVDVNPRWYNASYTDIQRARDIDQAAKDALQGKQWRAAQIKKVEGHADELHMDAAGWVNTLQTVAYDSQSVINQMNQAAAKRNRKAVEKAVDKETGEIKADAVLTRTLIVTGTMDQLRAVAKFMDDNNIKYNKRG